MCIICLYKNCIKCILFCEPFHLSRQCHSCSITFSGHSDYCGRVLGKLIFFIRRNQSHTLIYRCSWIIIDGLSKTSKKNFSKRTANFFVTHYNGFIRGVWAHERVVLEWVETQFPSNSDTSSLWTDYHLEFKSSTSNSQLLGLANEGIGQSRGPLGSFPVKSSGLFNGHTHTFGTFSTQISGIYASPHKNFPWLRCPRGKIILFFTHSRISWLRGQRLRKPYKLSGIV